MAIKQKLLVTTETPAIWPTDDEEVLFLAEWCKKFSNKSKWEKLDHETVTYPWNDRKVLWDDSEYLELLNERILKRIAADLNFIHEVSYPVSYWRIILGPWLMSFLVLALEKWRLLEVTAQTHVNLKYKTLVFDKDCLVAESYSHFRTLAAGALWNQKLIQELLLEGDWGFAEIPSGECMHKHPVDKAKLNIIKKLTNIVSTKIFKPSGVAIVTNSLGLKNHFKLQFGLWQLPSIWFRSEVPESDYSAGLRKWPENSFSSDDRFENAVMSLIPKHIPKSYLEGYKKVETLAKRKYPRSVRCILDANGWNTDDVMKFWMADKVFNGTKLYIFQHGGYYGAGKIKATELHERSIADRFLTWGWSEKGNNKIIPIGLLRGGYFDRASVQANSPRSLITVVQADGPNYANSLLSAPLSATQWGEYFESQFVFVDFLAEKLKKNVLIRLLEKDFSETRHRWRNRHPNVCTDDGKGDIGDLIQRSRILVVTYNSTTILETLCLNIPTVVFWNPNQWELRADAESYYKNLVDAKILHWSPEAAANHINLVWDDIESWWLAETTQNAISNFCERFARDPSVAFNDLKRFLASH